MNKFTVFDSYWLHVCQTVLCNQLLQITLIATVCLLLVKLLWKRYPYVCHLLLLLALVKCLFPPVVAGPLGSLTAQLTTNRTKLIESTEPQSNIDADGLLVNISLEANSQEGRPQQRQADNPVSPQSSIPQRFANDPTRNLPQVLKPPKNRGSNTPGQMEESNESIRIPLPNPEHRSQSKHTESEGESIAGFQYGLMIAAWIAMIGSLVMLLIAFVRLVCFQRTIARTRDNDRTNMMNDMFYQTCNQFGVKGATFYVSDIKGGPISYGIFRPTVVLPVEIVNHSDDEELRIILAHEVNHIKRYDSWVAAMQTIAVCFWWYHPLVWILSRNLTQIRENCCDLETMSIAEISSKSYCSCIINVLERIQQTPGYRFAGTFGNGMSPFVKTKQRMENAMNARNRTGSKNTILLRFAALVLAILILPGAGISNAQQQENKEKQNDFRPSQKQANPNAKSQKKSTQTNQFYYVGNGGIRSYDFNTSESNLEFPGHQNISNPVVSPNGKSIAYVSYVDNKRQVWVAQGNEKPKVVSPDQGRVFINQIAWSPDGKWLAYRTEDMEKSAVYLMKPDGSEFKKLKTFDGEFSRGIEYYNDFCWSPDSKKLAIAKVVEINLNIFADMEQVSRKSILDIYDLETGKRTEKMNIGLRQPMSNLSWSPNGKWIAYKSDRHLKVISANKDEKSRTLLEEIDPVGFPRWSPISERILVHTNRGISPSVVNTKPKEKKPCQLILVDLKGNTKEFQIDDSVAEIWYYDWTYYGLSIVFSSNDKKLRRLFLKADQAEVIAEDAGFWGRVLGDSYLRNKKTFSNQN